MENKLKSKLVLLAALLVVQTYFYGQGNNIDIRFLRAHFTDTVLNKNLVAIFQVSTRDSTSFPPIVRLPPKCTVFENGREKVILLSPHDLGITLDGAEIEHKHAEIYALIKDVIDMKSMTHSMIVTYKISNLNYLFKRMSLTPAFSEKKNQSIRVDKRCEFEIN